MQHLPLPPGSRLPGLNTELAPADAMVGGSPEHYLSVGWSALDAIEEALSDGPEPETILDLPCGHGRVARMLRARYPSAALVVSDIDADGVSFCADTFNATGVVATGRFDDFDLDQRFDLIWVGSLLTHLSAERTGEFLDFARRHMGPRSTLVATLHGPSVLDRLQADAYGLGPDISRDLIGQYLRDGYGFRGYDGGTEYGFSVTAPVWLETLLAGSGLRLTDHVDRGWDGHQDVVVLRLAPGVDTSDAEEHALKARAAGTPATIAEPDTFAGFDEADYLARYADVRAAVEAGAYATGLAHFLQYGWREGRHPFDPALAYAERMPPRPDGWLGERRRSRRVDDVWSESPTAQAARVGQYWMAHPSVRARSNRLASGRDDVDAYGRLAELLIERGWTLPIKDAISIGCGFGALERDLLRRGLVRTVTGFDLSADAIRFAREAAADEALDGITYHVADLEDFALAPGSIDVAFAHSSVHHVERLEPLYALIRRALRPGGILHLHEFIGPDRFQWTDAQLRLANRGLDELPPRLRRQVDGRPKPALTRPTIAAMIASDPSEAIRSSALIPALERDFVVLEYRPLGGAIIHNALGGIAQNFDPDSAEDERALRRLFEIEDEAMRSGQIGSDFATITATPRP